MMTLWVLRTITLGGRKVSPGAELSECDFPNSDLIERLMSGDDPYLSDTPPEKDGDADGGSVPEKRPKRRHK